MSHTKTRTLRHQVHSIDAIMRYFIAGFELDDGMKIEDYQWFYDARKGQVAIIMEVSGDDTH